MFQEKNKLLAIHSGSTNKYLGGIHRPPVGNIMYILNGDYHSRSDVLHLQRQPSAEFLGRCSFRPGQSIKESGNAHLLKYCASRSFICTLECLPPYNAKYRIQFCIITYYQIGNKSDEMIYENKCNKNQTKSTGESKPHDALHPWQNTFYLFYSRPPVYVNIANVL